MLTKHWIGRLSAGLAIAGALQGGSVAAANSPRAGYLELRRAFIIASALTPGASELRPEHRDFLRQATAYLRDVPADETGYRAAALFFRGRMLLHAGLGKRARQDFEACLDIVEDLDADQLPLAMASPLEVKMYRALTMLSEGLDPFLDELEAMPREHLVSGLDGAGDTLRRLASNLADRNQFDQAIRVHRIIETFELWDPEQHQDPARVIDILRYRKANVEGTE